MRRNKRPLGAWCAVACLVLALPMLAYAGEGGYAGDETCMDCHEDQAGPIGVSVHGRSAGMWNAKQGYSCEGCHGSGLAHAESGGNQPIFAFAETDSATDRAGYCLDCHATADTNRKYDHSSHLKGGVACNDCHNPHENARMPELLPANTNQMCSSCHQEVVLQSNLNERHRFHEGVVQCNDCHNPHEPSQRSLLGPWKTQVCTDCHTDKQGPYIYEHGSSFVEGCTACHTPHGSVNRHMLNYQSVADLCFSCHAVVPGFHSRFNNTSQCTNCHVTIHGSNLHQAFLN